MIKYVIFFLIVLLNYKYAFSRNIGETEITTEDGIEVFQEEKYYLLKKNVEIISDEFELNGNLVKIFFEKDLYDIQELIARGPQSRIEALRLEIFEKVNGLGIGAQGLGGLTTLLDVKIMDYPTHAAHQAGQ